MSQQQQQPNEATIGTVAISNSSSDLGRLPRDWLVYITQFLTLHELLNTFGTCCRVWHELLNSVPVRDESRRHIKQCRQMESYWDMGVLRIKKTLSAFLKSPHRRHITALRCDFSSFRETREFYRKHDLGRSLQSLTHLKDLHKFTIICDPNGTCPSLPFPQLEVLHLQLNYNETTFNDDDRFNWSIVHKLILDLNQFSSLTDLALEFIFPRPYQDLQFSYEPPVDLLDALPTTLIKLRLVTFLPAMRDQLLSPRAFQFIRSLPHLIQFDISARMSESLLNLLTTPADVILPLQEFGDDTRFYLNQTKFDYLTRLRSLTSLTLEFNFNPKLKLNDISGLGQFLSLTHLRLCLASTTAYELISGGLHACAPTLTHLIMSDGSITSGQFKSIMVVLKRLQALELYQDQNPGFNSLEFLLVDHPHDHDLVHLEIYAPLSSPLVTLEEFIGWNKLQTIVLHIIPHDLPNLSRRLATLSPDSSTTFRSDYYPHLRTFNYTISNGTTISSHSSHVTSPNRVVNSSTWPSPAAVAASASALVVPCAAAVADESRASSGSIVLSVESPPPPKDLTEEGVEPHPGPDSHTHHPSSDPVSLPSTQLTQIARGRLLKDMIHLIGSYLNDHDWLSSILVSHHWLLCGSSAPSRHMRSELKDECVVPEIPPVRLLHHFTSVGRQLSSNDQKSQHDVIGSPLALLGSLTQHLPYLTSISAHIRRHPSDVADYDIKWPNRLTSSTLNFHGRRHTRLISSILHCPNIIKLELSDIATDEDMTIFHEVNQLIHLESLSIDVSFDLRSHWKDLLLPMQLTHLPSHLKYFNLCHGRRPFLTLTTLVQLTPLIELEELNLSIRRVGPGVLELIHPFAPNLIRMLLYDPYPSNLIQLKEFHSLRHVHFRTPSHSFYRKSPTYELDLINGLATATHLTSITFQHWIPLSPDSWIQLSHGLIHLSSIELIEIPSFSLNDLRTVHTLTSVTFREVSADCHQTIYDFFQSAHVMTNLKRISVHSHGGSDIFEWVEDQPRSDHYRSSKPIVPSTSNVVGNSIACSSDSTDVVPPSPPLVGIESNPGPPKSNSNKRPLTPTDEENPSHLNKRPRNRTGQPPAAEWVHESPMSRCMGELSIVDVGVVVGSNLTTPTHIPSTAMAITITGDIASYSTPVTNIVPGRLLKDMIPLIHSFLNDSDWLASMQLNRHWLECGASSPSRHISYPLDAENMFRHLPPRRLLHHFTSFEQSVREPQSNAHQHRRAKDLTGRRLSIISQQLPYLTNITCDLRKCQTSSVIWPLRLQVLDIHLQNMVNTKFISSIFTCHQLIKLNLNCISLEEDMTIFQSINQLVHLESLTILHDPYSFRWNHIDLLAAMKLTQLPPHLKYFNFCSGMGQDYLLFLPTLARMIPAVELEEINLFNCWEKRGELELIRQFAPNLIRLTVSDKHPSNLTGLNRFQSLRQLHLVTPYTVNQTHPTYEASAINDLAAASQLTSIHLNCWIPIHPNSWIQLSQGLIHLSSLEFSEFSEKDQSFHVCSLDVLGSFPSLTSLVFNDCWSQLRESIVTYFRSPEVIPNLRRLYVNDSQTPFEWVMGQTTSDNYRSKSRDQPILHEASDTAMIPLDAESHVGSPASVPAPRLIGVELNPGPSPHKRTPTTADLVDTPSLTKRPRHSDTIPPSSTSIESIGKSHHDDESMNDGMNQTIINVVPNLISPIGSSTPMPINEMRMTKIVPGRLLKDMIHLIDSYLNHHDWVSSICINHHWLTCGVASPNRHISIHVNQSGMVPHLPPKRLLHHFTSLLPPPGSDPDDHSRVGLVPQLLLTLSHHLPYLTNITCIVTNFDPIRRSDMIWPSRLKTLTVYFSDRFDSRREYVPRMNTKLISSIFNCTTITHLKLAEISMHENMAIFQSINKLIHLESLTLFFEADAKVHGDPGDVLPRMRWSHLPSNLKYFNLCNGLISFLDLTTLAQLRPALKLEEIELCWRDLRQGDIDLIHQFAPHLTRLRLSNRLHPSNFASIKKFKSLKRLYLSISPAANGDYEHESLLVLSLAVASQLTHLRLHRWIPTSPASWAQLSQGLINLTSLECSLAYPFARNLGRFEPLILNEFRAFHSLTSLKFQFRYEDASSIVIDFFRSPAVLPNLQRLFVELEHGIPFQWLAGKIRKDQYRSETISSSLTTITATDVAHTTDVEVEPPAPFLVGIESNPGPPKSNSSKRPPSPIDQENTSHSIKRPRNSLYTRPPNRVDESMPDHGQVSSTDISSITTSLPTNVDDIKFSPLSVIIKLVPSKLLKDILHLINSFLSDSEWVSSMCVNHHWLRCGASSLTRQIAYPVFDFGLVPYELRGRVLPHIGLIPPRRLLQHFTSIKQYLSPDQPRAYSLSPTRLSSISQHLPYPTNITCNFKPHCSDDTPVVWPVQLHTLKIHLGSLVKSTFLSSIFECSTLTRLHLSGISQKGDMTVFQAVNRLIHLESLHLIIDNGYVLRDVLCEMRLTHLPPQLKSFNLCDGSERFLVLATLAKMTPPALELEELHLSYRMSELPGELDQIHQFAPNLKQLHLCQCHSSNFASLIKFRSLQHLHIQTRYILDPSYESEMINGLATASQFTSLHFENWIPSSSADWFQLSNGLIHLTSLVLTHFQRESLDGLKTFHSLKSVVFTVRSLELRQEIYDFFRSPEVWPNLERISINYRDDARASFEWIAGQTENNMFYNYLTKEPAVVNEDKDVPAERLVGIETNPGPAAETSTVVTPTLSTQLTTVDPGRLLKDMIHLIISYLDSYEWMISMQLCQHWCICGASSPSRHMRYPLKDLPPRFVHPLPPSRLLHHFTWIGRPLLFTNLYSEETTPTTLFSRIQQLPYLTSISCDIQPHPQSDAVMDPQEMIWPHRLTSLSLSLSGIRSNTLISSIFNCPSLIKLDLTRICKQEDMTIFQGITQLIHLESFSIFILFNSINDRIDVVSAMKLTHLPPQLKYLSLCRGHGSFFSFSTLLQLTPTIELKEFDLSSRMSVNPKDLEILHQFAPNLVRMHFYECDPSNLIHLKQFESLRHIEFAYSSLGFGPPTYESALINGLITSCTHLTSIAFSSWHPARSESWSQLSRHLTHLSSFEWAGMRPFPLELLPSIQSLTSVSFISFTYGGEESRRNIVKFFQSPDVMPNLKRILFREEDGEEEATCEPFEWISGETRSDNYRSKEITSLTNIVAVHPPAPLLVGIEVNPGPVDIELNMNSNQLTPLPSIKWDHSNPPTTLHTLMSVVSSRTLFKDAMHLVYSYLNIPDFFSVVQVCHHWYDCGISAPSRQFSISIYDKSLLHSLLFTTSVYRFAHHLTHCTLRTLTQPWRIIQHLPNLTRIQCFITRPESESEPVPAEPEFDREHSGSLRSSTAVGMAAMSPLWPKSLISLTIKLDIISPNQCFPNLIRSIPSCSTLTDLSIGDLSFKEDWSLFEPYQYLDQLITFKLTLSRESESPTAAIDLLAGMKWTKLPTTLRTFNLCEGDRQFLVFSTLANVQFVDQLELFACNRRRIDVDDFNYVVQYLPNLTRLYLPDSHPSFQLRLKQFHSLKTLFLGKPALADDTTLNEYESLVSQGLASCHQLTKLTLRAWIPQLSTSWSTLSSALMNLSELQIMLYEGTITSLDVLTPFTSLTYLRFIWITPDLSGRLREFLSSSAVMPQLKQIEVFVKGAPARLPSWSWPIDQPPSGESDAAAVPDLNFRRP